MRRKQIKKLADQIAELELISSSPSSSKDEKARARDQMISISGMIACLPDGLDIMTQIDDLVQEKLNKEKEVD